MYAEKRNPKTGRWEMVGYEFLEEWRLNNVIEYICNHYGLDFNEGKVIVLDYFKGVKASHKYYLHIYKTISNIITHDLNFNWWQDKSKLPHPKTNQPYSGRNYNLFGVLSDVRNYENLRPIDFTRGLPDDVSEEICQISDEWDIDGHSHNYLYLYEIINSEYYHMSDEELNDIGLGTYFFRVVVDSLLDLGNPRDVRIVFWFDN